MPKNLILLPFDGTPAATRASEMLAGYAGDSAALEAVLLNVQVRPLALWPNAVLDVAALEAALIDAGRATLAPAVRRLAKAGLEPRAEVRLGFAAPTILEQARARHAGLIVMGTRGAGALHGFALGSTALRVAHGGAAPVILVKPDARLPAALGRRLRVLLAADGSAPALRAAERLVAWRDWLGELEVQLVYAQEPLTLVQQILPPHSDIVDQWSRAAGEEATQPARALLERAGIAHHLHLTLGDPALEVMHLAEKTGSELVALGTRGRGAAHHALVGSVALKAAALSAVPVLVVA